MLSLSLSLYEWAKSWKIIQCGQSWKRIVRQYGQGYSRKDSVQDECRREKGASGGAEWGEQESTKQDLWHGWWPQEVQEADQEFAEHHRVTKPGSAEVHPVAEWPQLCLNLDATEIERSRRDQEKHWKPVESNDKLGWRTWASSKS